MRHSFLFLLIFAAGSLFAQAGASLAAEIQNTEMAAVRQGASPSERHIALVRLAQLRQLSGDIEGAAKNWLEAAAAIPGSVDDDALLACAYCLAAMGEWDRAATALEPLVAKNIRARFLDISIKAIRTGDLSALTVLSLNPEYSEIKNEILFFLWKVSQRADGGERWRLQLISEYPNSPEGRLAAGQAVINPNPFWIFISGLDSLPLLASESRNAGGTSPVVQPPPPPPVVQAPPVVQPPPAQPPVQAVRLQTGVFSREANAQSQAASLRQAGFSPTIEPRGNMWAVTVPGGQDINRSIADLRAAGFDSFPIR